MKRILTIAIALLAITGSIWAQKAMTPPHVMVVPDMIYCKAHGYVSNQEGVESPDYEKAMSEDPTLHSVLIQVAQLISDRNPDIVIVDLLEAINSAKNDAAMAAANSGDQYESVEESIIRNSEAASLVPMLIQTVCLRRSRVWVPPARRPIPLYCFARPSIRTWTLSWLRYFSTIKAW